MVTLQNVASSNQTKPKIVYNFPSIYFSYISKCIAHSETIIINNLSICIGCRIFGIQNFPDILYWEEGERSKVWSITISSIENERKVSSVPFYGTRQQLDWWKWCPFNHTLLCIDWRSAHLHFAFKFCFFFFIHASMQTHVRENQIPLASNLAWVAPLTK